MIAFATLAAGYRVAPAAVEVQQIPVVRLHAVSEVAAPPAAVWAFMTRGRNFVTWCPEWKSARNAAIRLARVGDSVDYADAWGNNGRSVVTYLSPNREDRKSTRLNSSH